jgi:signal transduction histidine kinase
LASASSPTSRPRLAISAMREEPTHDRVAGALHQTIAGLQDRLAESEATLRAIRSGDVDAIMVTTSAGEQVYSLKSADQPYREMIEAINEGVVSVVPDGMIVYSNQRFADMARADLNTVIGSELQKYFAGQDGIRVTTALREFGAARFRAQILGVDGATVPVNVALHRRSGGVNQNVISVVVSDLTEIVAAQEAVAATNLALEQRLAEQRLAEQQTCEHRYQSLLETMNDGLIETDEIPAFTYVNPRFAEMLGYAADERKRAERDLASYQQHLEGLVAGHAADLAAADQALNAANHELETFAFSVSHDLRAPLRAIDGFSHALQEDYGDKLDAEAQRLIQIIRDGVDKMARLIEDILEFSRAGRRELASTDIDMTGLVQATLNDLAPAMTGRKIKVNVVPLPRTNGDRGMLQRVWMNLLDNAIKFTAHKEPALIEVGSYPEAGNTVYFVKDNGAGFDMAYIDKLFGVFQRLHSAEDFPGTGAGLTIVKRIVGRHGGRAWAEGKVGEGATFCFALPPREPEHV